MRRIGFVTSSNNKAAEIQRVFGSNYQVDSLEADLPEFQPVRDIYDQESIIVPKLEHARTLFPDENTLIVEDTALYIDAMGGLPGPFIKYFLAVKNPDNPDEHDPKYAPHLLYKMARAARGAGDITAKAVVHIGLSKFDGTTQLLRGKIDGRIVPAGDNGWGFDRILTPDGQEKRLGDLGPDVKAQISHRAMAAKALKRYLINSG